MHLDQNTTAAQPVADRLAAAEGLWHLAHFADQVPDMRARAFIEPLVDKSELAWLREQERAAEPFEAVLFAMADGYASTTPRTKEAETFLAWIRKLADDAETPPIARRECLEFLAAPDAWPSVAYWREHGTYDGMP